MADGATEIFSFDKGINTRKSRLLLDDGELAVCSGFAYDNEGDLTPFAPRSALTMNAIGSFTGIHRYMNYVMASDADWLYYKWDLNGYCGRYVPPNNNFTSLGHIGSSQRPIISDFREFSFFVNKSTNKVFAKGNLYDMAIPNPTTAPSGAATGTGLSGTYSLYYTFLIMYPNGEVHETGPSPAGSVTVSNQSIAWTNIKPCPYQGNNLTIHRRLYRYSSGLGATYYIATIADNTTTTYTDSVADATAQTNAQLSTTAYSSFPDGLVSTEIYLQRLFGVKDRSLYWSEPYLPLACKTTSNMIVSDPGDELTGVIYWGDQLYLPTPSKWYRLSGSDPDTWSIRRTYTDSGVICTPSIAKSRFGIFGLWFDGLYLFDGAVPKNITEKKLGKSLFTSFTDSLDAVKACFGYFDGLRYWFYYPSSGTTLDSCIVIDTTFYPEYRIINDPFIAMAHEYHLPTGIRYMGKSDGYQYMETGTQTQTISLRTGDRAFQNITKRKNAKFLYYEIDTGGKNVTATIYVDGVAQTPTITLNTSTRTRDRSEELPNWEGYTFSIGLSCADASGVHIYSPWVLQCVPTGD